MQETRPLAQRAMLVGCSLSPGYGSGSAFVYRSGTAPVVERRSVESAQIAEEKLRFSHAVAAARRELSDVRMRVLEEIGEAESDIIGAHLLLLEDPDFVARIERRIEAEAVNAEHALARECDEIAAMISDSKSEVLRERAHDITDVKNRLLKHLGHGSAQVLEHLPPSTVLVARELLPSDTLNLDRAHVAAIVLERGAPHSHAAILARSMGIPSVGNIEKLFQRVRDGDSVFVDGERGEVLVDPDITQTAVFVRSRGDYDRDLSQLTGEEWRECVTLDGERVKLLANVGRLAEVDQVQEHHLDGVGLFRTEYLFLESFQRPTLDAQRAAYRAIFDRLRGRSLTIRTFDLGGDKRPLFVPTSPSREHSFGLRGLRFSLGEGSLLRGQVQAILEATAPGDDVALLLPMVVSAEDLESALELVEEVASSSGHKRPRVGAMIETPSALFEIEDILTLADFISVGTNDLTHFMIGAEGRTAGSLGDDSILQPAMLRALRHIAERAFARGRPVTVCGEAAGEPVAAAVLVGLGFRALSMSPARAARVRASIRANRASDLAGLSNEAVTLRSRERVAQHVRQALVAKQ